MAQCPNGHETPDGFSFCSVCGAALAESTASTTLETPAPAGSANGSGRSKGPIVAVVAVALLLAVAVGGFLFWSKVLNRAEVPDVSGMTAQQAETAVADAGLVVGSSDGVFDPETPKGEIIEQTPRAGTTVGKGTEVDLVVSKGPELRDLTFVEDLTSFVLDYDYDCSFAVLAYDSVYPNARVEDGSGKVVSTLQGDWTADPDNGNYVPCKVVGSFPGIPVNDGEYTVVKEPEDPIGNSSGPYSVRELQSSGWTVEE